MSTYKHVTVRIEQDEFPPNPRDEWDNLSTFYGPKGSRYLVGGKDDREIDRYYLDECIKELRQEKAIIVEFSSSAGNCYAVIERSEVRKEYGDESRSALYRARQVCKAEIDAWLKWCDGEVYGYIVENLAGEHLDSCWGFYGHKYATEEAESSAKYWDAQIENDRRALAARVTIGRAHGE